MPKINQKGAIPVLVLVAIIGIISFLAVSSLGSFKDNFFASLFPKPASRAVSDPISSPITPSPAPDSQYRANLVAAPGVTTSASGYGHLTFGATQTQATLYLNVNGISVVNITGAHIHLSTRLVNLNYSTLPSTTQVTLTQAEAQEITSGTAYINIHTNNCSLCPNGEIQGNFALFTPTPTPSSSPNPLPGDIIVNGKVDIFDYNALIQDFGKTSGFNPLSDIIVNNKIDIFDYNALIQNFGRTIP